MSRDDVHEICQLDPEDFEIEKFGQRFDFEGKGFGWGNIGVWDGLSHGIAKLFPERALLARVCRTPGPSCICR